MDQGLIRPGTKIFMIGIGGSSMVGLAELSQNLGLQVSGSDMAADKVRAKLEAKGIHVFGTHARENIQDTDPDLVVYSLAVPPENPERQEAADRGIPLIERGIYLGLLNRLFKDVYNITGTNGKTTTTAMLSKIFQTADLDPTVHLGAPLKDFGGSVRLSEHRDLMVSEACEYGASFLSFFSTHAVILNISHDHVDIFPELKDVVDIFKRFALTLKDGATLFLPTFDPPVADLVQAILKEAPDYFQKVRLVTYGYNADLSKAFNLPQVDLGVTPARHYEVTHAKKHTAFYTYLLPIKEDETTIELKVPGRFNLDNALAASVMALDAGVAPKAIQQALEEFKGAEGRFTFEGEFNGAKLYQDYAHTPDALAYTLDIAREMDAARVLCFFQPITYSRAKAHEQGFIDALGRADYPFVLEVFDDREKDHSYSTQNVCEALKERGKPARYFPDVESATKFSSFFIQEGDLVLFIGQTVRKIPKALIGGVTQ